MANAPRPFQPSVPKEAMLSKKRHHRPMSIYTRLRAARGTSIATAALFPGTDWAVSGKTGARNWSCVLLLRAGPPGLDFLDIIGTLCRLRVSCRTFRTRAIERFAFWITILLLSSFFFSLLFRVWLYSGVHRPGRSGLSIFCGIEPTYALRNPWYGYVTANVFYLESRDFLHI